LNCHDLTSLTFIILCLQFTQQVVFCLSATWRDRLRVAADQRNHQGGGTRLLCHFSAPFGVPGCHHERLAPASASFGIYLSLAAPVPDKSGSSSLCQDDHCPFPGVQGAALFPGVMQQSGGQQIGVCFTLGLQPVQDVQRVSLLAGLHPLEQGPLRLGQYGLRRSQRGWIRTGSQSQPELAGAIAKVHRFNLLIDDQGN